jgi:hypothetical protein
VHGFYWYLYVTATGHGVVSSMDLYGGPEEDCAGTRR